MLNRLAVVAFNAFREAVRARILLGLFALAFATAGYSVVVGAYALRASLRTISDIGAASMSLYAIAVAIVIGASSLYRELELKTIFPILARPIRRTEYIVGKYLGTLLTLGVFLLANSGVLLLELAAFAGRPLWQPLVAGLGPLLVLVGLGVKYRGRGDWLVIPWAIVTFGLGLVLSDVAADDRRVVVVAGALALLEVGVVVGIAHVFSAFSSPFLTAIFTLSLWVVGRRADILATLPPKVFGPVIVALGDGLSRVVPNLMVYVPPRTLMTGEALGVHLPTYLAFAALQAVAWVVLTLAVASALFRRRDFL